MLVGKYISPCVDSMIAYPELRLDYKSAKNDSMTLRLK